MLLYSDIPRNKIYKWTKEKGIEVYLDSAGYTGENIRGGELGSNGLLLNSKGQLVLCQHGDRRMAMMDADLATPQSRFISIVDSWNGKKFNSPNDATYRSDGALFFTDPPYGLERNMEDSLKEIPFQGVYMFHDGKLRLLIDSITRPNGIALLNNEKSLLVANSDPEKPFWYLFDLNDEDSLVAPRIFYNSKVDMGEGINGLPDGLKVTSRGYVFATGPGGVYIFNPLGKLIGRIRIPQSCSNVGLDEIGKNLFITADSQVFMFKDIKY
jgi:gluconolactonase